MAAEPCISASQRKSPPYITPTTAERCVSTARAVVFTTVCAFQFIEGMGGTRPSWALLSLAALTIVYVLITSGISVLGREDARTRLPLLVVDVLLVSGLIQLASRGQSELYLLYYIPILQAGVRLTLRDAIASAILSAALYGLITVSNGPFDHVVISAQVRSIAFGGSAVVLAVVLGLLKRDVEKRLSRQDLLAGLAEAICTKAAVTLSNAESNGKSYSRRVEGAFGASFWFVADAPRAILQVIGTALGAIHRFMYVPGTGGRNSFWIVSSPKDDITAKDARKFAEQIVREGLADGKAVAIQHVAAAPRLRQFARSVTTALVLPIMMGDRVMGVVVLCGKEPTLTSKERIYTQDDLRLAFALAPQAALLLDYARVQHGIHLMLRRVVGTLAAAIDAKDPDTRGHSQRVAHYATFLARVVGLSEDWVEAVELGALLHDTGKIGLNDTLLQGMTSLGEEEWDLVRQHPSIGQAIFSQLEELDFLLPALESHHERFDGTGYPHRLSGRKIPMLARIIAIADAFDAMTSPRRYRPKAMTFEEARDEILSEAGGQFDPELARIFSRHATPQLIEEAHAISTTQDEWRREIVARSLLTCKVSTGKFPPEGSIVA
ncbi:MAG: HD domain-containing phosphohydrolase [Candidatus Zipacnadales bacterium]